MIHELPTTSRPCMCGHQVGLLTSHTSILRRKPRVGGGCHPAQTGGKTAGLAWVELTCPYILGCPMAASIEKVVRDLGNGQGQKDLRCCLRYI